MENFITRSSCARFSFMNKFEEEFPEFQLILEVLNFNSESWLKIFLIDKNVRQHNSHHDRISWM